MINYKYNDISIDVVFTWVNGNDELHYNKMLTYIDQRLKKNRKATSARYRQVDEIKYAIDSIYKFAPYIRKIFIITDHQTPYFLLNNKQQYTNVQIIDHSIIFKEYEHFLPTFNNRSIETLMYRIPDLSEHFIYFNDDFFLVNPTIPDDFFLNGLPVLRGKWISIDEKGFINRWMYNIGLKKKKINTSAHKLAQQKAAKLAYFDKKYFKFGHTPHPLRKSSFEKYFKENPEILKENIQYKFRNSNQFTPQGLMYHIEINENTCILNKNYQLIYIGKYNFPILYYKFLLYKLKFTNRILFLNLQNLEEAKFEKMQFLLHWLKNKLSLNTY